MARIRSIKPEFWADEKIGPMKPIDRLVFLGLISTADDAGRLVDSVKQIDATLFPYTDDSSRGSLERLASAARIIRYQSASGQRLIQVANWSKHQKIDHPNLRAALPGPPNENGTSEPTSGDTEMSFSTASRAPREPVATRSGPVPTISTNDHQGDGTSRAVLEHYVATHPRRRIGDPKQTKSVQRALGLGFTVEQLCRAITANKRDPWHAERKKHELTYVLRDADKINDFLERFEQQEASPVDADGILVGHR